MPERHDPTYRVSDPRLGLSKSVVEILQDHGFSSTDELEVLTKTELRRRLKRLIGPKRSNQIENGLAKVGKTFKPED